MKEVRLDTFRTGNFDKGAGFLKTDTLVLRKMPC